MLANMRKIERGQTFEVKEERNVLEDKVKRIIQKHSL